VPQEARLPGLEHGHVWSPEAVLRREAQLGDAVIVYDEGSNWRGVGTAWALAEQGKRVLIVTPETFVGKEIARTAADGAARRRMAQLGVQMRAEHMVMAWHGNGASLRNLLTGEQVVWPASDLVMATTNVAFDPFPVAFDGKVTHRIGDCAAPRLAAYAFYEGRKAALAI
jgi:pyruvate/2-oxoglutarate dehydrogenase complex dihydrolipoamide dehydrogenase (E3) component